MSENLIREQVLLKPETIKRLKTEAEDKSISLSAIIRQIIENYHKAEDFVKQDIENTI